LLSRCSLNRRAAAPFIVALPVLPFSSRCHCLHCRATAAFLVVPLLPLLLHCRLLHCCTAAPFIVPPPVLPLVLRRHGLRCRAATLFLVAPLVLLSSSRCRCLCHHAAAGSAFVVAPLPVLHSSSRRRCLHCRAAAAFLVAPPLPSLLRRRWLHRCAAAALIILAIFNISYHIAYNMLFTIHWLIYQMERVMLVVPLLNSSTCYFSFLFILLFLSWPWMETWSIICIGTEIQKRHIWNKWIHLIWCIYFVAKYFQSLVIEPVSVRFLRGYVCSCFHHIALPSSTTTSPAGHWHLSDLLLNFISVDEFI
jgi:hypothetical protein